MKRLQKRYGRHLFIFSAIVGSSEQGENSIGIFSWVARRTKLVVCAVMVLASVVDYVMAGLPEPGITLYGVITEAKTGHRLQIGSVDLSVNNTETGRVVPISASMANYQGGYSFTFYIPFERPVANDPASASALVSPIGPTQHEWLFSVNGQPAIVLTGQPQTILLSSASRGTVERLDLSVDLSGIDSDGDGLPDWYEEHFGFDPNVPENHHEVNQNGLSNVEMYVAGLDPNETGSSFRLEGLQVEPLLNGLGNRLMWKSVMNRLYTVYRGTSLTANDFQPIANGLPATPPLNVFDDASANDTGAFYYISVELAP